MRRAYLAWIQEEEFQRSEEACDGCLTWTALSCIGGLLVRLDVAPDVEQFDSAEEPDAEAITENSAGGGVWAEELWESKCMVDVDSQADDGDEPERGIG